MKFIHQGVEYDTTDFNCSITRAPMNDPVTTNFCGHSFDQDAIEGWLAKPEIAQNYWVVNREKPPTRECPVCRKYISKHVGDLGGDYGNGLWSYDNKYREISRSNHLIPNPALKAAITAYKLNPPQDTPKSETDKKKRKYKTAAEKTAAVMRAQQQALLVGWDEEERITPVLTARPGSDTRQAVQTPQYTSSTPAPLTSNLNQSFAALSLPPQQLPPGLLHLAANPNLLFSPQSAAASASGLTSSVAPQQTIAQTPDEALRASLKKLRSKGMKL